MWRLRPEQVNKWPNSSTARWWLWWWLKRRRNGVTVRTPSRTLLSTQAPAHRFLHNTSFINFFITSTLKTNAVRSFEMPKTILRLYGVRTKKINLENCIYKFVWNIFVSNAYLTKQIGLYRVRLLKSPNKVPIRMRTALSLTKFFVVQASTRDRGVPFIGLDQRVWQWAWKWNFGYNIINWPPTQTKLDELLTLKLQMQPTA